MSDSHIFPPEELSGRVRAVQGQLTERHLDGCVLSVPENIYYLTGLSHWGYFACHVLIVPTHGDRLILVARAIEQVTFNHMVHNAEFSGYKDHEPPGALIAEALNRLGLTGGRIGVEKESMFLTPKIYDHMKELTPHARWEDCSNMVDTLRLIKSPLEMEYTRMAAKTSDAGMMAAIEAIRVGASDLEIAGECHKAMFRAGSEYPGFGPFIRFSGTLGEEHGTWRGARINDGDAVFLELTGSYQRYQAPMGRMLYAGSAPSGTEFIEKLCIDSFGVMANAIKPGVKSGEVYKAWHDVVADAGLPEYHRHHCGYVVGIAFPPSWVGGSMVVGLAPNSEIELKVGMVFHLHSWFTDTGKGDYWVSNTAMLTKNGCEILTTQTPMELQIR